MARSQISPNKDVRALVRWAEDLGYEAARTKGGHIRFVHDHVTEPIFCASSPSDHRALKNTESLLAGRLNDAVLDAMKEDPSIAERYDDLDRALECPACRGKGVLKLFTHPQGLIAHMAKEHPAPTIVADEPPLETAPSESVEEEPMEAPEPEQTLPSLTVAELEDYLEELFDIGKLEEGCFVTINEIRQRFPDRRYHVNAVTSLKKRQSGTRLVGDGRGEYVFYSADADDRLYRHTPPESAPEGIDDQIRSVEAAVGEKFAPARIFEELNKFVDGRLLLRDAEGRLYQADIEPLN